uniref:Uncharacterized protein LOC102808878 n=1 Tax=Saccoglossus kowalevskii TaxID=10224 RepID=A0ABM0MIX6_SACKO
MIDHDHGCRHPDVQLCNDLPLELAQNSTGSLYLVQITSDGIKWKETSFPIKYRVTSLIGEGGMRNCYNCDLLSSNVLDTTLAYVVKTYKDSTIRTMYEIHYKPHLSKSKNEAIISMTKKEVQSQMSARMLSLNFKDVIPKEFGEAPRIIPCYMIQDNNSHHVYVLEEKLKGKFVKYMNNDGR